MKLRSFHRLLIYLFCFAPILVSGQKYSNEFLSLGIGARGQALANAVVASVEDVTAGYWNPAGLKELEASEGMQLGAMHAEWFAGEGKFDYLAFTLPLNKSDRRIGFSIIRFGIDGIPNTLTLYDSDGSINIDNITEFSEADYAFLLSYAQSLKTNKGKLSVGGNVKVVHRNIGPFATSWGFGVDLGAQYKIGDWKFGAVARDISTTFNAWSFSFSEEEKDILEITNNEIPINSLEITKPQLILGVAREFQFKNFSLQPEIDLIITTDGKRNTLISSNPFSIDPALGLELNYKKLLFLRTGANQFQKITDFDNSERLRLRPTAGLGLQISNFTIDYAFSDLGSKENTYSHVISLLLKIKPRK